MKILSIYTFDRGANQGPPSNDMIEKMGALIGEMTAAGVLVDTGGVIPTGLSARVRHTGNGSFNVTDGPFAETKEVVGGFAVLNVASKEDAVRWTERFLSLTGTGTCNLIEVSGPE
jgi:hypothetical protein